MTESNDQRFIDIEMKLSHQEYLIDELNQVVKEQTETITRLEAALKKLSARVAETVDARVGAGNEKPPHY